MTDQPNATTTSRVRLYLVGALVVTVVAAAIAFVVVRAGAEHPGMSASASASSHRDAAPLDLKTVSAELAGHYDFAAAHAGEYRQIPCWCGCQQYLEHRNLEDCYVRADGKGWEAHAAGCGVCQVEAVMAEQMLGARSTPAQVATAVHDRFGATAITTPPSRR